MPARLSDHPAPLPPLEEGTDYLFCPICGTHAPCRPTPGGGWEAVHGAVTPAVPRRDAFDPSRDPSQGENA
ncbi:MAG: hypothetical protein ACYDCL_18405 [Myxococcales bacterium]